MKRYNQGLVTASASLALIIATGIRIAALCFHVAVYFSGRAYVASCTIQILAALICLSSCLCLPRRPSVLDQNHIVDGQYTVSALSSYTFGFASNVLSLARKKASLELADLPKLHLWGRSSFLLQNFDAVTQENERLWKSIFLAHRFEFLFQIGWAMLQSALAFAPQLVMYQLLRLLEQRSKGAPIENIAWGLVFALGGSILLSSWTQAWAYWICWARLGQPIRAELSALIFSKSLRRKDVKGVEEAKAPEEDGVINNLVGTNQMDTILETQTSLSGTTENNENDEEDEGSPKTRQSTINLVVSSSSLSLSLYTYRPCKPLTHIGSGR